MKNWFWGSMLAAVSSIALTTTAQAGPSRTLDYLYSISGKQTLSGQHNREPNADPDRWTEEIRATTGKYPALWSGDFLFQGDNIGNRWTMINEAKEQWDNGAIVNLMWHACSPAKSQPCGWDSNGVLSKMSDWEWSQLLTNGTPINQRWKEMMDEVAIYLQYLEDQKVEVLFRPLHEMNQGVFWWGGRPGANGTRKLYQMTHDYFTQTKGLSNLVWVWDMQDFGSLVNDLNNYNPGSNYWDVAALDVYEGFANWKYQAMVNISGGKPIAIGECDKLPTATMLANEPRWAFFMGWSELTYSNNSTSAIQSLYNASRVVTRDEMPGWDSPVTPPPTAPNIAYQRPVSVSSTEAGGNVAANAVDANGNTRWSSAYTSSAWMQVDLGSPHKLNRVRLQWEAAYARAYQVQVSNDGASWTTVYNTTQGDGGLDDITVNGTGRYLRVLGTQRATQWGYSLWEFEAYGTPSTTSVSGITSGATYRVLARHSGKALDVQGGTGATQDGANVHQWEYLGQSNQQWVVTSIGSGYYTLVARHSGKALDVSAWSTVDGGNVQQWPYQSKANQQWKIENLGNGYYKLLNRHSGKALDVAGGTDATQNAANVHQWQDNQQTNQQWQFVPVQ